MRLYLASFHLGKTPEKFVELLKGKKNVAIVMNARDHKPIAERTQKLLEEIKDIERLGLSAKELDLRNYFGKADVAKVLRTYDAVLIPGGNVFVLRRAMSDSGFDTAISELLKEDGIVYASYSAGGCVLSPTLRGYDLVDDPALVKSVYGKETVWDGLNIIPYSIAPHYKSDHPETAMVDTEIEFLEREGMSYKALRDGQAILVDGDRTEIVG